MRTMFADLREEAISGDLTPASGDDDLGAPKAQLTPVITLKSDGFRRQLKDYCDRGAISPPLQDALVGLIERQFNKREHSCEELPLLTDALVWAVKTYTNFGLMLFDDKPYQLCALKSRNPKKQPRLTMVYLESALFRVYPI